MKISAVIITLNEEKNIARCLNSLKEIADEIIIVDSGSTDRTRDIAEKFNKVNFITKEWEGYSKTKNFGNQSAKYDWILSIDADEEISDELKKNIINLKKLNLTQKYVYCFARLTNYCGQWIHFAGWYPDMKPRLFPKKEAFWEGDYVHENLHYQLPTKILKGDLLHYSYQSIEQHKQKTLYYARLQAQKLLEKKVRFNKIKLYLSPIFTFIKMYFVKLGILEGKLGFHLCWISAWGNFKKYELLNEMLKNYERKD